MSRRTRNPFAKISHFFKQHSGPSRLTPSSSGPAHTQSSPQPSSPSPPCSAGPSTPPPCTPSPAVPPPTSPAPQPVTLPPAIPPPPPQSSQLPERPVDFGMVASPSTYNVHPPTSLLSSPPTSGPTPYISQPPVSHTRMPQFGEPSNFSGAHDFNIYNPQFNDYSLAGSGLKELLKHSMPDAFHNSAARYPPPKCHLGTREEYITKVTNWAFGNSDRQEPILWMRGPFGVGKSAVAQSCAEALEFHNKLAAALFFSRSNADRDDPRRVFTSIAYQIAAACQPFSNIIDARIRQDPAIAMKSLSTQFDELLVRPLIQIGTARSVLDGCVVVIDGLDECRGSADQCEIIRVIATSIRDRTTPFRWFITSRPEDSIIRTMRSPAIAHVSFHLELPVSRKIDHEILLYLTDEFKRIRENHGLPESWPSEEVITLLVDRTAGLWIYASTIIRFITDENSLGPRDQLQIVVEFAMDISAKAGPDNPLAEMDFFYVLIMKRIPLKIRTLISKILLLHSNGGVYPVHIAAALDLSEEQFRRLCGSIQSVLELQDSEQGLDSIRFRFYHASFLDFMRDPERSRNLSIHGNFLIGYRRECLDWLYHVCSRSTGPEDIAFPSEPVLVEDWTRNFYYHIKLFCFWELFSVPNHSFDLRTAALLENIQFRMMLRLLGVEGTSIDHEHLQSLRDNLPTELRDKIIRLDKCPTPGCKQTENVWILGHGENETVMADGGNSIFWLNDNQNPNPGLCFCGSEIKM